MGTILIVDDEPNVVAAFEELLGQQGHRTVSALSAEDALEGVRGEPPDVAVIDICLPGMTGLEAFRRLRAAQPRLPVIVMTGQGTMDSAIEATKLGAFDYQLKPLEPEAMLSAIERALDGVRIAERHVEFNPAVAERSRDALIGQSPGMQEVYKAIGRVAATDATVLIRGESGCGKELVARAIYQHSRRAEAPLLVVNCVAIPETLLETDLFGHERGAFTGAASRRIGKFEQANRGTLFLDEIGDVPLSVQAKLLRVLQERYVERVGGTGPIPIDVRVLAATNRNLEAAIAAGTFREDLYYRLNVVQIAIPPLRDRRDDIPRLSDYFLDRFALDLGIPRPPISDDARQLLCSYSWPGNVRELEHCIYRAMIFTHGYPIGAGEVMQALKGNPDGPAAAVSCDGWQALVRKHLDFHSGPGAHDRLLELVDRQLIMEALERTKGNQTHAARLLGLTRPTLHAKLRKYGVGPSDHLGLLQSLCG
jgi:DNA-binding NtrC family response regulator